ncbi:beta-galactosidase [Lentzea sp. JNUCC 0626]|uniref:beta-galactosidase n=1 Tax=Lentzea sp. JNUCC 0626 TaxID=3367513 RepID=UPI00374A5D8C
MRRFAIGESDFLLDGNPFQVVSGALHYFRVHPGQWADRIDKARGMGLNTIETCVPWNAHAPTPHEFDFADGLDLGEFLRLVHDAGLYAIVRPGPYIGADWDNGGLPAWLQREDGIGIRGNEPRFLAAVREYLRQVYSVIEPLQINRDGPVILVQLENEYGAFGADPTYLRALVAATRAANIVVPLTTADRATDEMLASGGLPELHRTASFGADAFECLTLLRAHQPTGPLMCAEFRFHGADHWGDRRHVTPVSRAAAELETMLAFGASVNISMFHGGTNFGLMGGASDHDRYRSAITSYDCDAALDEAGHPATAYYAFRELISRYRAVPDAPLPAAPRTLFLSAQLCDPVRLLEEPDRVRATRSRHHSAPALDELDGTPRFAFLSTNLWEESRRSVLSVSEVRDHVSVFLDSAPVGTLSRELNQRTLGLPHTIGRLTLMVEDHGRVSGGHRLGEPKGVIGGVAVNGVMLRGWEAQAVSLDQPPVDWCGPSGSPVQGPVAGPVALHATFLLDEPTDLHLDVNGWGRGVAWVNGFCLGRYWSRGPQFTLYVPRPVLRSGHNELVVVELEAMTDTTAFFVDGPSLGHDGT